MPGGPYAVGAALKRQKKKKRRLNKRLEQRGKKDVPGPLNQVVSVIAHYI